MSNNGFYECKPATDGYIIYIGGKVILKAETAIGCDAKKLEETAPLLRKECPFNRQI